MSSSAPGRSAELASRAQHPSLTKTGRAPSSTQPPSAAEVGVQDPGALSRYLPAWRLPSTSSSARAASAGWRSFAGLVPHTSTMTIHTSRRLRTHFSLSLGDAKFVKNPHQASLNGVAPVYISPHSAHTARPSAYSQLLARHTRTSQPPMDLPVILQTSFGRLLGPVATFSIFLRTSMPSWSTTLPNTTCLPSRKGAGCVVMKNWHPFVCGPELACAPQVRGQPGLVKY
jgi:hypothetical protein